ncbi:MAG TPA: radical SAM protein [Anaerolineaceae bacterium]|nr:radical SAM protein [Anaerolineaceae bacterium]
MKERLRLWYDRLFPQAKPLEPGVYHYQAPPEAPVQYRLHLRIEPGGEGVLIVNASTVLHLNRTAVEYAYHLVNGTPEDETGRIVAQRYNVAEDQARQDYQALVERIRILAETPDLDPVTFLDFERADPYATETVAPYRLDCALTYKVVSEHLGEVAPVDRVKREMLTDEWKTILDKAWNAGIPHVVFTGGEPTLRPDLPEIIQFGENLGMVTGLLTNGWRLSETDFLHQVLQSGLDHILLVLNPEEGHSWEALRDTLAEDIYVTVHLTLTQENRAEIPALLDRLKEMGVPSISLSAMDRTLDPDLQIARDSVAAHDMTLVWDLPVPYSANHPVALELEQPEEVLAGPGRAWLYVEPDGDVLPAQGTNQMLGNLLNEPWETVWERAKSRIR